MTKPAFNVDEPRFRAGLSISTLMGRKVVRTKADVLDHLESRSAITQPQYEAGCRFQMDYERGVSGASTTCAYERQEPTHNGHQEGEIAAADRWRRAVQALGPVGSDCAIRICCENMHPTAWAHAKGEGRAYGMGRLREALDVLDEHYGV